MPFFLRFLGCCGFLLLLERASCAAAQPGAVLAVALYRMVAASLCSRRASILRSRRRGLAGQCPIGDDAPLPLRLTGTLRPLRWTVPRVRQPRGSLILTPRRATVHLLFLLSVLLPELLLVVELRELGLLRSYHGEQIVGAIDAVEELSVHTLLHCRDELPGLDELADSALAVEALWYANFHGRCDLLDLTKPVLVDDALGLQHGRTWADRGDGALIFGILEYKSYHSVDISDRHVDFVVVVQTWLEFVEYCYSGRRDFGRLAQLLPSLLGHRLLLSYPPHCLLVRLLGQVPGDPALFRLLQSLHGSVPPILRHFVLARELVAVLELEARVQVVDGHLVLVFAQMIVVLDKVPLEFFLGKLLGQEELDLLLL